jgi:signal peptidase I
MAPTLQGIGAFGGDWVLTEKVTYWFRNPRRWEIVRFLQRDGYTVMKRVAGLPDETVGINDFHVQIDGRELPFPDQLSFIKYYDYGNIGRDRTVKCDGGYFVLGDDSVDSLDSRYEGVLPSNRVQGRVWMILWPPKRIGFVSP